MGYATNLTTNIVLDHGVHQRENTHGQQQPQRSQSYGQTESVSQANLKVLYSSSSVLKLYRWLSLIDTQAWLHSLDPDALGLEGYGKKKDFYARQCNTFARIEADQAKVRDHKTGELLGRAHEYFDDIMEHIKSNLPRADRCSIVHGDFKFDNLVSGSQAAS